ncbi:MAG: transcriptional regulator [Gallionellales bacterium RIFCSPLOWO2_12_FULL_59_22]|nr:MAG: transcriptional regulator [Gallionellales bacterium RIFCSPLOWO2_02_FULL_59_110]OGT02896.1 MAG: transcriptional regulator [Gallionellales bacterium RIFCSPLOWO2_02_58_13]OGT13103.1 MAG: transcriptional regulator [Gallionellales bacterium RIFCSPLOWO2_12_FULL_59_22]
MSATTALRLCLVEDDPIMGESLCDRFELEGFACDWHQTAASALASIGKKKYAVAISDIRLGDASGMELFAQLKLTGLPLPPFIFITGYGSIDTAVELLKQGAEDYITKPFDLDLLLEKIRSLSKSAQANQISQRSSVLGISAEMRRIADALPRLSSHANTILITGESGVGKEVVAKELHCSSPGHDGRPFVAVNCGAITESLLEAELFGYEKGAFTGATRTKKGFFEQANGGSLFLDEIGDMPLSMQVKLLRAIQERCIVRVGGETSIPVNLRLICATHRDLKKMAEQGAFREDLFYRINVIHLKIPPLNERKEDILWFAGMFLKQFAEQHDEEQKSIHPSAEAALLAYGWPGNIRELKHHIERACILTARTTLMTGDLFDCAPQNEASIATESTAKLANYLHACERLHILNMLNEHQWQMNKTAAELGISRKNLWEKIKKLGIRNEVEACDCADDSEATR